MRTLLSWALGAAILFSLAVLTRGQSAQTACTVIFLDGVRRVVNDCAFRYSYLSSYSPATGLFYSKGEKVSTDLMIQTWRTKRGADLLGNRAIALPDLSSLRFAWETVPDKRRLRTVTITLRTGEVLSLDYLSPAVELLSLEPGAGGVALYLVGTAEVRGQSLRFSTKSLTVRSSADPSNEVVMEIRFGSNAR